MKSKKNKSAEKERKDYVRFCPKCISVDINQEKSTMQSLGFLPTKYICSNCGYFSFNFPEINIDELDKLNLQKNRETEKSKNQSGLVDKSLG